VIPRAGTHASFTGAGGGRVNFPTSEPEPGRRYGGILGIRPVSRATGRKGVERWGSAKSSSVLFA